MSSTTTARPCWPAEAGPTPCPAGPGPTPSWCGPSRWPRATWAPSPSKVDIVNDLVAAKGDRLDLSAIDADVNTAGDHAGEMILTLSGCNTLLALDVEGDGRADCRMTIVGNVTGDSGGWLL